MKKMGRLHRPFFRICAMNIRAPRDGKVIEELGTYDPLVPDADARAVLDGERIKYWLGVGAQPSDKVKILIRKYGANGTRLPEQQAALARLAERKPVPPPGEPAFVYQKPTSAKEAAVAEAPAEGPDDAAARSESEPGIADTTPPPSE
jgi:small subunit ribosomal protein S16